MIIVSFRGNKKIKKRIVLPVQSIDNWRGIEYCNENFKALNSKSLLLFIPVLQMFWFDWVILIGVLGFLSYWIYKNWSIKEETEETEETEEPVQIDQNLLISAPANETDEFEVYGRNGGEEEHG